jgi:hypothetical protein
MKQRTSTSRKTAGPTASQSTHMRIAKSARLGDQITYRLASGEDQDEYTSTITEADSFDFTLADGHRAPRDPRQRTRIILLSSSRA